MNALGYYRCYVIRVVSVIRVVRGLGIIRVDLCFAYDLLIAKNTSVFKFQCIQFYLFR